MKKTHKKILGSFGLGLVAVTTVAAAMLPSPTASAATTGVTDTIQVTVVTGNPDISATTESASEITSPEYAFSVTYNRLTKLKITLKNYDEDGNVKFATSIFDEPVNPSPDTKNFNLNLDNYGGKGNFVITIAGTGDDGVELEQVLSVEYTTESEESEVDPDSGEADVDVDIPTDKVTTATVNVYDSTGALVKTVEISNPSDIESIDLSDLPDGVYTLEISGKDASGNTITGEKRTAIVDTGSNVDLPVEIEDQGEEIGQVVITIVDENGETKKTITIDNPTPGDIENINFDGLDSGNYDVVVDYYDKDGNKIDSTTVPVTKSSDNGETDIPIDTEVDSVTIVEANIYDANGNIVRIIKYDRESDTTSVYDANGNLLFTVAGGYKDGKLTISMEGLPYEDYTTIIMFRDEDGRLIGDAARFTIKYYGKPVIVPDTGSFFQGLNISREDYLITGAIVFMVIGVVAFGVVKRSHTTSGKMRINGKRR